MRHPPGPQLPQYGRLAARRHLARPLTIDPEAKGPAGGKGQIDQFDFQLLTSLEVANDQAAVRFGTRPVPFYRRKSLPTSQKSKMIVHDKIYVPVHDTSSPSS